MSEMQLMRTFLAVYRAGTLTRAARELHLTQPAVSQQVKALEAKLGRPLFNREPRGVTPTTAGVELAQAVATHIDAIEALLVPVGRATDYLIDTLHIGGPEELLASRVIPTVAPLVADGLRLRMRFGVDAPIVEMLVGRELDLAITTGEWRDRGLDGVRLYREELILVGSPLWADRLRHLIPGREGAEQLKDVPILAYDESLPLVSDYWRVVFGRAGRRRGGGIANGLRAVLSLAIEGAGITVLPSHVCEEAFARGLVVPLLQPETVPSNQLWLM
ncbi:MAG: LysR family transcriptional regulator, partial [Thermoleophilia bacterium]|nr:LysR family transcriptional regulator [Thermoleophilia bacterium]